MGPDRRGKANGSVVNGGKSDGVEKGDSNAAGPIVMVRQNIAAGVQLERHVTIPHYHRPCPDDGGVPSTRKRRNPGNDIFGTLGRRRGRDSTRNIRTTTSTHRRSHQIITSSSANTVHGARAACTGRELNTTTEANRSNSRDKTMTNTAFSQDNESHPYQHLRTNQRGVAHATLQPQDRKRGECNLHSASQPSSMPE